MNIQDATKLQDLFLQIEDIEARDALLVILTKLADRDKLPNDFNIFEDNIQDIKDTGFVKTEKLDDFTEEQTPKILIKKPITKEEQEDIDTFTKDLMQDDIIESRQFSASPELPPEKDIEILDCVTGPRRLLKTLGIRKQFMQKYGKQYKEIATRLYSKAFSTYIKPNKYKKSTVELWENINKHADSLGYTKDKYKPRIRYAATVFDDEGYLKDLLQ